MTKEERRAYNAVYRKANPGKKAAIQAKYRANNPEKIIAYRAAYNAANPDKRAAERASQRARKYNCAVPLTPEERKVIAAIYKQARKRERETGEKHHVDHIHPLMHGGKHHPSNLQVLTAAENLKKAVQERAIKA